MRPGRQRWRYHNQLLLLLLFLLPGVANSVKCYCTDDHCVPYGSCDGTVCLVGILRDSNQVIRTCGTNTLGCHKNEDDKWTDLCACDQPFCNTFAFLRTHTRRTSQASSSSSSSSSSSAGFAPPSSSSSFDSSRQEDSMSPADPHHDAPLVFHRMDRPDDGIPPPPPGLMEREGPNKTSLLTLLLVVVPLTVGAATVMVVAFNYYCHLC
ncbi:Activin_recp domain-containing protein [Caenorhabditis elegans]|uniref:Activin_recp domain-containing protein n=1 Tax=Caenorhabditis elegans TaxID=6239 RepID=Q7JKB9_CAEEL|nr:Activin_recp domain-containing protein [Caenorhabditis elegans]CAE46676.1 Activin_recp domain-containing protein [Caenorhabditis elegans]|eukprot:NP_001023250.1 Uncharacterized protein CELE_H01G02.3 [Caenorhabditis elegans]